MSLFKRITKFLFTPIDIDTPDITPINILMIMIIMVIMAILYS